VKRIPSLLLAALFLSGAAAPGRISIDVRDASLQDVLALLASQSGVNIVADGSVRDERVSLHLRSVTFDSALRVIAQSHDLELRQVDGVLVIGRSAAMNRRGAGGSGELAGNTAVIVLAHAQAENVARELTAALPDGAVVVADKASGRIAVSGDADTLVRAKLLAAAFDVEPQTAQTATVSYRLRYVKASAAAVNLKGALSDGAYLADDAQNAIVVTGDAVLQDTASRIIRTLDVAAPQVSFEVRVADLIPSTESSNIGIEFGGYDLSGQALSGAATYAFTKDSIALNARLNAMMSRGKAQILATPKLVTLNNKEADLLIGETYPVIYYDARVGGQQVQFVDVGVKLRLTPTIGADGSVIAEMHPEYSAIQTFVGGYPVIANRKIDSTLRVRDGETIVLGGLLRDIDSETITRVPWLADIPVLGKVFQNREQSRERDEIVFLITPHILPAPH
jgi:type II secretory pathway component GspD/PulD (secretin)